MIRLHFYECELPISKPLSEQVSTFCVACQQRRIWGVFIFFYIFVYPISTGAPWFNLDSSAANATRWLLIDCSSEVMP